MDHAAVLRLPVGVDAPGVARSFIAEHTAQLRSTVAADAQLLTSEVVTNAVRHGRPPTEITVELNDGRLRISVSDGGPEWSTGDLTPAVQPDPSVVAEGGYGLLLVEELALEWGVVGNGGRSGKAIWFELGERSSEDLDQQGEGS